MAEGEVIVIGARLPDDAPLIGRTLKDIGEEFEPDWDFVVGSIGRGEETIIPRRDHRLEPGDHVRVAMKRRARKMVGELLGLDRGSLNRIMLLGGGRTAEILAERLSSRGVQVVIVERNPARARTLAENLDDTLVLEGDIADADLLEEADIGRYDMVVALTGEDDANILACLYAKSVGAGETVAVVHRLALLTLLGQAGIDVALSPRTATANGVLRFVRGDVAAVATFLQGDAEVIELEIAPDSPADGSLVKDLGLPKDVLLGAIVRDGKAADRPRPEPPARPRPHRRVRDARRGRRGPPSPGVSTRGSPEQAAPPLQMNAPTRTSYARLAITDSVSAFGALGIVAGLLGIFDDRGDATFLVVSGIIALATGLRTRQTFARNIRPAPGRVLSGLALSWIALVLLGTGVYLATGTIDRVDDALVEAAAGFSTTSVTTLDPSELSVPMQIWRASTQWFGGLLGIIAGVIALPLAFRGRYLAINSTQQNPYRLAPTPEVGRRRVSVVYLGLTIALGFAYALVGLGARDSVVHAMTTISTGGFSSNPDSFVGFGTGPRVVATVGMIIGGSSFFVIWWIVRGRMTPVWRSTELRLYVGLLTFGSILVALDTEGISILDAAFTSASALTTTGFAVGDWTVLNDALLTVLLVMIGTGSMSGSAGGGLRVIRAWMLVGFASRELRRQLDPHSIVVVKQGGVAIDESTLERNTGYQIAHLGLCFAAAFLLAATGVDLTGAIYTGVSVISTHGPGVGVGPYGDLSEWSPMARLMLTPFMLAGRLSILPLLLGVSTLFATEKSVVRQGRRLAARTWRR